MRMILPEDVVCEIPRTGGTGAGLIAARGGRGAGARSYSRAIEGSEDDLRGGGLLFPERCAVPAQPTSMAVSKRPTIVRVSRMTTSFQRRMS